MKNIIKLLVFALICSSCNTNSQNSINKAAVNDQVTQKLAEYKQQEHRLAFSGCKFSYNEQFFNLGMTIEEVVTILGPYDYHHLWSYVWGDIGIVCSTNTKNETLTDVLEYINVYMNTQVDDEEFFKHELNHKKDYFLINGVPLRYDMAFSSFVAHSTYKLGEDIVADNHNYYIYQKCPDNNQLIKYRIDVTGGIWNRSGGGHLTFRGSLNENNDSPIEYIGIGYDTDEE